MKPHSHIDIREVSKLLSDLLSTKQLKGLVSASEPLKTAADFFREASTSSEYAVIKKLVSSEITFTERDSSKCLVMLLDTETTGLDVMKDRVCQLGYVLVHVDDDGALHSIHRAECSLHDPGIPISKDATLKHGFTDSDVFGKSINLDKFYADIKASSIICAHNLPYDRKLLENTNLLPEDLEHITWVDSLSDIDWAKVNVPARNLETLTIQYGYYYESHGALEDAYALYTILKESNLFQEALKTAVLPEYVAFVTESPFDKKDELKEIGCSAVYIGPKFSGWKINLPQECSEIIATLSKLSSCAPHISIFEIPKSIRASHKETELFTTPEKWLRNRVKFDAVITELQEVGMFINPEPPVRAPKARRELAL